MKKANKSGEYLRALRERAGMSLSELAEKTELSVALLSLIESGKRELTADTLKSIDRVLVKALAERQKSEQRIRADQEMAVLLPASSAQFTSMTVGSRPIDLSK